MGNVSDTAQVDAIGYLLLELKYSVADGNPSGGMLEPPVKNTSTSSRVAWSSK